MAALSATLACACASMASGRLRMPDTCSRTLLDSRSQLHPGYRSAFSRTRSERKPRGRCVRARRLCSFRTEWWKHAARAVNCMVLSVEADLARFGNPADLAKEAQQFGQEDDITVLSVRRGESALDAV